MGVINFNGQISPTFFASFRTFKAPGCHRTADDTPDYFLANEAVFEFRLEVQTPGGVVVVERHATAKDPLYDKTRPCYVCDPTPAAALEKLADAVKGNKTAPASLKSVKVWLKPFFLELVKLMTREDADSFTLARPDPASKTAMEGSFNHRFQGDVGIVSHPDDVKKEIQEIPCELTGVTVFPPSAPGQPPRVALSVIMRIREKLSRADCNDVARIFIAADYTKIYKFGKTKGRKPWFAGNPATGIEAELKGWEKNVARFLFNHTSMNRGDKIFKEIVAAGTAAAAAGKTTLEIVKVVRDEIDARLITANHWGQRREDRVTETYQRKLSDVLGAIHQSQFFMASPVAWLRNLQKGSLQQAFLGTAAPGTDWAIEEQVAVALQWGVGHCGEHCDTSFQVLKAIMNAGHAAKFDTIVSSGNANVDHAFVVGGFKVTAVASTTLSKEFYLDAKGDTIDVFDLKKALAASGTDGFVLDPYLAPGEIAATCKGLLAKLNDKSRAARRLRDGTIADCRTDHLRHNGQHPATPAPTRTVEFGLRGL